MFRTSFMLQMICLASSKETLVLVPNVKFIHSTTLKPKLFHIHCFQFDCKNQELTWFQCIEIDRFLTQNSMYEETLHTKLVL